MDVYRGNYPSESGELIFDFIPTGGKPIPVVLRGNEFPPMYREMAENRCFLMDRTVNRFLPLYRECFISKQSPPCETRSSILFDRRPLNFPFLFSILTLRSFPSTKVRIRVRNYSVRIKIDENVLNFEINTYRSEPREKISTIIAKLIG